MSTFLQLPLRRHAIALAAVSTILVACGGGSDKDTDPQGGQTPSSNQKAFEGFTLAPATGSFTLHWYLANSGAQVSGTNFVFSDSAVMAASPAASGAQTVTQTAPLNLTNTLTVVTPAPARVLKKGAILVAPVVGTKNVVSYTGNDVRVDTLAADNTTVAFSEIRSNYETVALSGAISATPADFAHFYNSLFANTAVLDGNATYAAGASYLKYKQTVSGDRYNVFDCKAATTGAAVSPCATGTTLTAALTAGIISNSDGVTYKLADGAARTVDGVSMWVATNARPVSATLSSTVQYRIYFELAGNIYTGALIKDGTVLGGSYYLSNPNATNPSDRYTFLPFDIKMNKAAHDSLKAAMKI